MPRAFCKGVSILFVLILVSLWFGNVLPTDDEDLILATDFLSTDPTNYIDPHDMLHYDRRTFDKKPDIVIATEILENVVSETSPPEKCQPEKPVKCLCPNVTSSASEKPFLGRFIKILSKTLNIKEKHIHDGDILHIPLLAVITKRTQFVLSEIIKEGEDMQLKNLADLDEILSTLLVLNIEQPKIPEPDYLEIILNSQLLTAKGCLVLMFCFSIWMVLWMTFRGHAYKYIAYRSFVTFFFVSWFWHWNHMNQLVSAKRQSDLLKNGDKPGACKPEQLGMLEVFQLWFSSSIMRKPDPCEEYHRAIFTDPIYEVNPFVALIDMLVVAIFQPLSYMGKQFGSFFDSVLSSSGFLNQLPVFVAVLAVLFLILVMSFRYEIHLPFFKIRPTASPQPIATLKELDHKDPDASLLPLCKEPNAAILQRERSRRSIQPVEETAQENSEEIFAPSTHIEELRGILDTRREQTSNEPFTAEELSQEQTCSEITTAKECSNKDCDDMAAQSTCTEDAKEVPDIQPKIPISDTNVSGKTWPELELS